MGVKKSIFRFVKRIGGVDGMAHTCQTVHGVKITAQLVDGTDGMKLRLEVCCRFESNEVFGKILLELISIGALIRK